MATVWLLCLFGLGLVAADPTLSGLVAYITNDTPLHVPQVAVMSAQDDSSATPTILTNFTSWNQYPTLSRDRTEVIWGSGVEWGVNTPPTLTHLFRVPVDKSAAPKRVTNNDAELTEITADFSPDNTKMVVVYSLHNSSAGRAANYDRLAIIDNDGSNWTPIMDVKNYGYNDYFAKWNPVDQDMILFRSDRNGIQGWYVYRLSTETATIVPYLPPLSGATGNGPTWAVDGNSFYYEAYFPDATYMVSATLDGKYQKLFPIKLVDTMSYSGVLQYIQCANGPNQDDDGQYFVCTRTAPKGDGVSIVDHSGNLLKDLTPMGPEISNIYHWMPDWK